MWLTSCSTGGVPHFFKQCVVTQELFEFIIELWLTETSGGLAKHIRCMLPMIRIAEHSHQSRVSFTRAPQAFFRVSLGIQVASSITIRTIASRILPFFR